MLTPRGWWFLVLSLTVAAMGGALYAKHSAQALWLCSLTLIFWFGTEWAIFQIQAWLTAPRIVVNRLVLLNGEPAHALWCNQDYEVIVQLSLPKGTVSHALCDDRSPVGTTTTGSLRWEGRLSADTEATWIYQIRPDHVGAVRFEGVAVRLTDLQGFFYAEQFVRAPVEILVLPLSAYFRRARRGDKRVNSLPPPGVHRFRRPGTGSELLELREYRPGDPPRRIAWRLSAKNDQLITRVYESEVPLRCTMFIDATNATRLGPPGRTAIVSLTNIASAVAGMAMANRDLVGLAITTEHHCEYASPARTSAQLVHIHHALARAASLLPVVAATEVKRLIRTALPLANDLYPDLMRPGVNRFPWWLGWLCPAPVRTRRGRKVISSSSRRWLAALSPRHRDRSASRKRLAGLLVAKYGLPPEAIAYFYEDNAILARWLQYFLAEHQVPADVPVYDPDGSDRYAGGQPLQLQAKALMRAVSRGRDNELFVLMGEYVERSEISEPLLSAIRVARGRHHQVLVIQGGQRVPMPEPPTTEAPFTDVLAYAEHVRRARAWQAVQREFGRLGVPMIAAGEGDAANLILYRLEQIRMAEGARRT